MTNIWSFLLQTLTVSLTAALLYLCKRLFQDKLPPLWQYGIWAVLALRILLPVQTGVQILVPLPLYMETLKTTVESRLSSAYASPSLPLSLTHVFPMITAWSQSITDWLFCMYAVGVVVSLVWYGVAYLRLRLTLHQGKPISPALSHTISQVCENYQLKPCQTVTLPGIPSAFVCGGFRPVLVLPETMENWEEEQIRLVLLHELLHRKYRDSLVRMFWCVLRSLHWCNPFMWWIFRQIECDMEALCDSRVLSRLDGEEQRTYGHILLNMVTERSPHAPGISSIANGKKNITKRIEAIARFSRYPKGMEIAALCITVLLAFPVLAGTMATYDAEDYTPKTEAQLARSLAMTRLNRCQTIAGALDTWAQGMLQQNSIYLATVSPLQWQESYRKTEQDTLYALPYDKDFALVLPNEGYQLFHLTENEDGSYSAWVVFAIRNANDVGENSIGREGLGSLCVPVRIWYDNGWEVEEDGERLLSGCDFDQVSYPGSPIEPIREWTYTCSYGTVMVSEHLNYQVENVPGLGSAETATDTIQVDAQFRYAVVYSHVTYTPPEDFHGATTYGIRIDRLETSTDTPSTPVYHYATMDEALDKALASDLAKVQESIYGAYTTSSFSGGYGCATQTVRHGEELHPVYYGSGDYFYDVETPVVLPYGYVVQITWGVEPMEQICFTEDGITVTWSAEEAS